MLPARAIAALLSLTLLLAVPPARAEQAGSLAVTPPGAPKAKPPRKQERAHTAPKPAPVAPVHPAGRAAAKPTPVVKPKATPSKNPVAHGKPGAPPAPPIAAPATPEAKPATPAEPPKGSATGLPLPRFAALRSDDVNMRGGPGTRYPIEWVYKRRDLPVQIEREFEVWRLVQDQEGVKGWVHQATLTGRRSFVVIGAEQTMRSEADGGAAAVAILKPGVIGRIRGCQSGAAWCEVQVGDYRGWLQRTQFWGSYPSEAVNP